MKSLPRNIIFTGALAAVIAVIAFILPPLPVWITDNGNKYIIMRNFAGHNTVKLQHQVAELAPTGGFHIQHHEGALRSFYPEFYPVLCSYFYSGFGERAAGIPAAAGTLICALLVLFWTKNKYASAFTALGTALFFYSFVLWEMTLSCAAVTGAILLALKMRRPFAGGVLLGLSLFLREEAYFAAASLAFAMFFFKQYKAALLFCAGAASGMIPAWAHQYIQFGSILGLHGKTYLAGTGEFSFSGIIWNYFHHLLRNEPTGRNGELWLTVVPFILLVLSGFFKNVKFRLAALFLMLSGAVIVLVRYLGCSGFSYPAACSTGFFAAAPVGWLFFADLRRSLTAQAKIYRILSLFVLVYVLTVPSVLTRGDVGLIWSARHFMVLMPVLVILSLKSIEHFKLPGEKSKYSLLAVIAAFAICQQLTGIYSLFHISNEARELENAVKQYNTQVVATDVFYLPEMTPQLWFDRVVLDISTPEKVKTFTALRPEELVLVLSAKPQFRRISNAELAKILSIYTPAAPPQRVKRAKGTGFIDLILLKLVLNKGAAR